MDSDSARVLDKDGKGITSTDMGGGHTGLDVNAVIDLEGATVEVGEVDQGVAGIDPWAVEFLTPQHVVVDSGGAVGLTDTELRATPVPVSGTVTANVGTSAVLDNILAELQEKTEPANTQITVGPPDLVTGPDILDATAEVASTAISGYYGVSVTVTATGFTGTYGFGTSYDGGTTYQASYVFNAAGQLIASLTTPGTTPQSFTYPVVGGASHVRVDATSVSAGSLSVTFRKTAAIGMPLPYSGLNSGSALATSAQVGGQWLDVINLLRPIGIRTGTPLYTDSGLVVKQAPEYSSRSDTYTAAANGTAVNVSTHPRQFFSMQVKCSTDVAIAWNIVLEGSLNGTNYDTIFSHTEATGDGKIIWFTQSAMCLYFRSRCVSTILGDSTGLVTTILGRY